MATATPNSYSSLVNSVSSLLSTKFCLTDIAAYLYVVFLAANLVLFSYHCLLVRFWAWKGWREAYRKYREEKRRTGKANQEMFEKMFQPLDCKSRRGRRRPADHEENMVELPLANNNNHNNNNNNNNNNNMDDNVSINVDGIDDAEDDNSIYIANRIESDNDNTDNNDDNSDNNNEDSNDDNNEDNNDENNIDNHGNIVSEADGDDSNIKNNVDLENENSDNRANKNGAKGDGINSDENDHVSGLL